MTQTPPSRIGSFNSALPGMRRQLEGIEREVWEVYSEDNARTRGILYRPAGKQPKVGVHLTHPRGDFTSHYAIEPLVRAGYLVFASTTRWLNNDSTCIHEVILLDMAAAIRLVLEQCEQVVLLGISGGSSLAPFYQGQATTAAPGRLTDTAAGDPFDLNTFDLPTADGLALLGEHMGEGRTLMKWIDPSVTDESDPMSLDASLDMFQPDNGFRIPPEESRYSAEFYARYREAQVERVRRLDTEARRRIAERRDSAARAAALEASGNLGDEWRQCARRAQVADYLQIYRTQADPQVNDHSIDPDDRDFACFPLGPPNRQDLVNYRTLIAAYLTPEAWLSTWSGLSSRAETAENLARFDSPLVMVHYCGDWLTRVSESRSMFEGATSTDKEWIPIRNVDHWGRPILADGARGDATGEGLGAIVTWLEKKFPL
jgi:hypothetical protein